MIVRSLLRTPQRAVWCWTGLLGVLSAAVGLGLCAPLDHGVEQWMAALRPPALEAAARGLTFFGSTPWSLAVMAAMSAWWWRRRRSDVLNIFWGSWGAGVIAQVLLRLWVAQWRPDVGAVPGTTDLVHRVDLAGFTSGHAFRSAFLYGWWAETLLRRRTPWSRVGAVGLFLLVGLVGMTRIYLHRHWLSDVLGGWLVALAALSAAAIWRGSARVAP